MAKRIKILYQAIPALILIAFIFPAHAQSIKELKMKLNDDGSEFLKFTFTNQTWLRYNQSNPGTTVNGYKQPETWDIGLRRTRMQFFGKISDRVFFYTQFGQNNFSYNTATRKANAFFHDVTAEYYVTPKSLQIGAGLTAWTGFSRFSSPAVGAIMMVDAPLFEQATNDANDLFLRKLSVYAKGKLGKLDYRIILSDPFITTTATSTVVKPLGTTSDFSARPPKMQSSAYVMYQFFEQESNQTPYMSGTYLGKKKILNLGAGFEYQPNAMWHIGDTTKKDTVYQNMLHYAVDLFYDAPLNKEKGTAVSFYAAYLSTDFGKNYVRNLGAMNPGDTKSALSSNFNGGGSAYPQMGTGTTWFVQAGFILPKKVLGEKHGQLMPYASYMHANFERLNDAVQAYHAGMQWLIEGHRSKLGFDWENRPVFNSATYKQSDRKNMFILQYQVAI